MKTDMSEIELAQECAKGNNKARRKLYDEYGGALMAICLRYLADRETAEDVFHDGILRIFQTIGRFTYLGEGSLKAWLSRLMANEALGYLRKQTARVQREVATDEIPDMPDEADDDLTSLPASVLMDFIRQLPEGYRTVFNLYVFEEKSHKEIGRLLGITEHTSSSQFYRARCLLVKKIKEYKEKNR